ncbi:hypothetical protein JW872_01480 [Candidatus Babeliales bacterium]|nr:hypothetical protein [Candidatus Babeliales bacterium]
MKRTTLIVLSLQILGASAAVNFTLVNDQNNVIVVPGPASNLVNPNSGKEWTKIFVPEPGSKRRQMGTDFTQLSGDFRIAPGAQKLLPNTAAFFIYVEDKKSPLFFNLAYRVDWLSNHDGNTQLNLSTLSYHASLPASSTKFEDKTSEVFKFHVRDNNNNQVAIIGTKYFGDTPAMEIVK